MQRTFLPLHARDGGTIGPFAVHTTGSMIEGMKRVLASTLWLYAFWSLGSMISALVGVPDLLGPILGTAAGVIVGVDPRRVIWVRPAMPAAPVASPTTA